MKQYLIIIIAGLTASCSTNTNMDRNVSNYKDVLRIIENDRKSSMWSGLFYCGSDNDYHYYKSIVSGKIKHNIKLNKVDVDHAIFAKTSLKKKWRKIILEKMKTNLPNGMFYSDDLKDFLQ